MIAATGIRNRTVQENVLAVAPTLARIARVLGLPDGQLIQVLQAIRPAIPPSMIGWNRTPRTLTRPSLRRALLEPAAAGSVSMSPSRVIRIRPAYPRASEP